MADVQRYITEELAQSEGTARDEMTLLAFYMYAVQEREREQIPLLGPSVDRRTLALVGKVANSDTISSLMCFACAQIRTHVESWNGLYDPTSTGLDKEEAQERLGTRRYRSVGEISYCPVKFSLLRQYDENRTAFFGNFSWTRCKAAYASDRTPGGNVFEGTSALRETGTEWRRIVRLGRSGQDDVPLLCCPEDVKPCRWGKHGSDVLCGECEIPLCLECERHLHSQGALGLIPMALGNDNFWSYSPTVVYKHRVRWIEAAIVSPCVTNMLVYYVEGDKGHLMDEVLGQKRYRTIVRGSCASFHMPWEDVLKELNENCLAALDATEVPRGQECLKYLLRVHMRVGHVDFKRHLRQVHVRPYVLLLLLDELIAHNHEVFRGKGSAIELRQRMRDVVSLEYPETEVETPEAERQGHIPASILAVLQEAEAERSAKEEGDASRGTGGSIHRDKNATPGPRARSADEVLDDVRPHAVINDRSTKALCDPGDLKASALARYGDITVQTGYARINQWRGKCFSQILPFVIPFMVSGPDYEADSEKRWRRREVTGVEEKVAYPPPFVTCRAFAAGFAHRAEAASRTDFVAVPCIRSVSLKHVAEHTMCAVAGFAGKRGQASDTFASDCIAAAKNLFHHLHNGFTGSGLHRVPIGGDTTRLPFANGLSPLEKKLAWAQHYLAENFGGSQQVRRIMGHRQFGARVHYGDCLFFTVSPNETQSAMVLKLSRFRKNDPYVTEGDYTTRRLASKDYPRLEAKRQRTSDAADEEILMEFPEYDLRAAATARDPLAVVEGLRVQILLRLAHVLGVRMCPRCPRCNTSGHGCQDRFGSNMRPMGGVVGGMLAFGSGVEHQGVGTPHLHAQGHVVSAFQFGTMADIAAKLRDGTVTSASLKEFQAWFHCEDVIDAEQHELFSPRVEQEWKERFASSEHAGMVVTPEYLTQESRLMHGANVTQLDEAHRADAIRQDGLNWKAKYARDSQFIFSRVQHHVHHETKKGFAPLKACLAKTKKNCLKCKHDFPKTHLCSDRSLVLCPALARRFGLKVRGKRSAFASMLGLRRCGWQSGALRAFAVLFRSNTHTMPGWRVPLTAETHEDAHCASTSCQRLLGNQQAVKVAGEIAQRVQREGAGYYCGYTFKPQPVGVKFVRKAAQCLDYLDLGSKTDGQKWHRISHRVLQDFGHRCMTRTAPEEFNLSAQWHEQDVTNAEFLRTFQSVSFQGRQLVRRLEAEEDGRPLRDFGKVLPTPDGKGDASPVFLKSFDDLCGYRGTNREVYYLNAWEFYTYWDAVWLPEPQLGSSWWIRVTTENEKEESLRLNPRKENKDLIFYPHVSGDVNLRELWYMSRRRHPQIPAPTRCICESNG